MTQTQNPLEHFLDWIYPPACIACKQLLPLNEEPRYICADCKPLFVSITGATCQKCSTPIEADHTMCRHCQKTFRCFTSNTAVFLYKDLVQDLLHDIKFRGKRRTAWGLGLHWGEVIKKTSCVYEGKALVPVPMHPKKKSERGFNQAQVMAKALSRTLGIPTENALVRKIDTPPMAGLPPALRTENVSGAFEAYQSARWKTKEFVLIDDIYTTGASLNECAKTLLDAGATSVSAMTLSVGESNSSKD